MDQFVSLVWIALALVLAFTGLRARRMPAKRLLMMGVAWAVMFVVAAIVFGLQRR